ncbi:MAG: hypothetical protein AAB628_00595 [Patescibacteria group bacterium]
MFIFPDQGMVFGFTKCGFKTSGKIMLDANKSHRWCPDCHSQLLHCNHCNAFTSGTTTGADVTCDNCKKTVKPEALIVQS